MALFIGAIKWFLGIAGVILLIMIENSPEQVFGTIGAWIDWFGFSDSLVSFQLFQTWITNLDKEITQDEFDTIITLLIQRDFMNETLEYCLRS